MKIFVLTNDQLVFGVLADSFPDGVLAAHQRLHALIQYSDKRGYYGISSPAKTGKIEYLATAEELVEGEFATLKLQHYVLPKGNYRGKVLKDYHNDISGIGKLFSVLIEYPDIDPLGKCVEVYLNEKDVQCMVRLKD